MKRIIEIIDRLQQGVTHATLCRAEDQRVYVVKTRKQTGSNAIISEWIAGRIGLAMGLPIPPIETLYLEPGVAQFLIQPDAAALAESPSFGSSFVDATNQFSPELNDQVPDPLRARILFFDWWVRNQDRSDGNPNLLWDAIRREIHVIDHNMAFDRDFDAASFWEHHLFRESRQLWDAVFKAQITKEIRRILTCLPDYWGELPPEWTDTGGAVTMAVIENMLREFEQPTFWSLP